MPADEDGYTGPATLVVGEKSFEVEADLRGHFQPIDGYYRWYGRIAPHDGLHELLAGRKHEAELRTPEGSARGELSDRDPWGRYRVLGASTPPFAVPTSLAEPPR